MAKMIDAKTASNILGIRGRTVYRLAEFGVIKEHKRHNPNKAKHFGLFDRDEIVALKARVDVSKFSRITKHTAKLIRKGIVPNGQLDVVHALPGPGLLTKVNERIARLEDGLKFISDKQNVLEEKLDALIKMWS